MPNRVIHLHKANPITEGEETPNLHIMIDCKLPEFRSLQESHELYVQDADMLVENLMEVIPQGMQDRLLTKLLERKASLMIYSEKLFLEAIERHRV